MKKETKLYIGAGVIGVLFLISGQPLLMGCGVLAILLFPMDEFTKWSKGI